MDTDRSRIITAQRCLRERYLAYHHMGKGLQRTRKSLPLAFGSAFHEGAERLLSGDVEAAVDRATGYMTNEFAKSTVSFDGELPDDAQKAMAYGADEQMALAEALLRGWWAFEGEDFLRQYEVIEVEKEGRAILHEADPYCPGGGEDYDSNDPDPLVLMFRPDALVRERSTGDLYIISWKTCATFGKRNMDQARTDHQSISEVWGVEQTHSKCPDCGDRFEEGPQIGQACDSHQDLVPLKIEGVLYKWIVKGMRRKDNWDGLYKTNSHLIYGWRKLATGAAADEDAEWSWAYEWEKEDGSGSSRLGKGWQKKAIWSDYPGGVAQWISDLKSGQIFPRHLDPLATIFPAAMPVSRRQLEVESWKRQVVAQELRIAESVERVERFTDDPEAYQEMLDEYFPQYTNSCWSYSGCSFISVCHEGAEAVPGDLYQIRRANHPECEEGE